MKIVAAGTNPVQLTRGIEKTVAALVKELAKISTDVTDDDLINVATVSAGGNEVVGSATPFGLGRISQGVYKFCLVKAMLWPCACFENTVSASNASQSQRYHLDTCFAATIELQLPNTILQLSRPLAILDI